jgi:hypothetical protein
VIKKLKKKLSAIEFEEECRKYSAATALMPQQPGVYGDAPVICNGQAELVGNYYDSHLTVVHIGDNIGVGM